MISNPQTSIDRRGGLAATHELATDGFNRSALTRELRSGSIIRIRQGWYARPGLNSDVLRAARVGGRLTCVSALRLGGIWAVDDERLHIAVDPHDCQLRSIGDSRKSRQPDDSLVVHWRGHPGRSRLVVDPLAALRDLTLCASSELVTASADSFLRQYRRRQHELASFADDLPAAHRVAFARADGVCESGIETIFWLRMQHPEPRRQVKIRGVGRVDFLFGRTLVVEVDGAEYHANPAGFEKDRRRDALLSALGFRVLRFSFRQVMFDWAAVEAAVRAALERGDHY